MITNNGLIIRTLEEKDLQLVKKWNNQQARGDYQEFNFQSLYNIKKEFEKDGFNSEKFKMLLIEIKDLNPIGLVYINFVRKGLARIGIVLCEKNSRGQGFGSKATDMVTKYIFNNFPIERIEADTDLENIPAQRVLLKSDFKKEGVLRHFRYHHGEWRDFVVYSILRKERLNN
ncbi:MAG: GNAT family N-acetyltransferase [Firmicutes bacterium]|nr:GNAT family N-acetyltransferase [Bacillota bacterium]